LAGSGSRRRPLLCSLLLLLLTTTLLPPLLVSRRLTARPVGDGRGCVSPGRLVPRTAAEQPTGTGSPIRPPVTAVPSRPCRPSLHWVQYAAHNPTEKPPSWPGLQCFASITTGIVNKIQPRPIPKTTSQLPTYLRYLPYTHLAEDFPAYSTMSYRTMARIGPPTTLRMLTTTPKMLGGRSAITGPGYVIIA